MNGASVTRGISLRIGAAVKVYRAASVLAGISQFSSHQIVCSVEHVYLQRRSGGENEKLKHLLDFFTFLFMVRVLTFIEEFAHEAAS